MDKLRGLRFFCRIVEAKSFSAAARVLGVPPSMLSKTIAALERDMCFTLFNRSTRQLVLTEAGAGYYERCRELLSELDDAEIVARDGAGRPSGLLRIGIHPVFRDSLNRRLGEFLVANPQVNVEISHTNSPTSVLREGIDVMLRVGAMTNSNLVAQKIGSIRLMTCASPAYLDAHGRPMHPRELRDHWAIIPGRRDEDSFTRWTFLKGRERQVVTVPVRVVLCEGVGFGILAMGGIGIVRFYDIAARPFVEEKMLEPILEDWSTERQPVYVVTPSRRNVPAKVRAFVAFARSLATGRNGGTSNGARIASSARTG